jgi:hypothetical protein
VLTQHELKRRLRYYPETGVFIWLIPYQHGLLGARAGSVYPNGYRYVQLEGKDYRTGRLAWFYMTGEWPTKFVDHKDTDKSNDAWDNLRLADDSQNQANRGVPSNNTSGTKGVRFEKDRQKWRAQIVVNGRSKNLGRYCTREEAMNAYERAAKAAWGEFART